MAMFTERADGFRRAGASCEQRTAGLVELFVQAQGAFATAAWRQRLTRHTPREHSTIFVALNFP